MRRVICDSEVYPFYTADPDYDADEEKVLGWGVDLPEEVWADYDRVTKEADAWQEKLTELYEAAQTKWWESLSIEEQESRMLAWKNSLREAKEAR